MSESHNVTFIFTQTKNNLFICVASPRKLLLCCISVLDIIPPTHLAQLFHSAFYFNETANKSESQQMDRQLSGQLGHLLLF